MLEIKEGCMAFLVDNPHPFPVKVHVNERTQDGLWECVLCSEIHHYQTVFLNERQLARITHDDELIIELYARGLD